jgi:large subunit ribosomal protein L17
MRHRVADKKFNRTSNARKALFTGMLRNLTEHGEIVTTLAKAKAVKRLADRMVSQAKNNTVASRRLLHKRFGKRDVVSTLVEKVAPAMADRTSGYVSVIALGPRRGDNTPMARLAFVKKAEGMGTLKNKRTKVKAATKTAKVAKSNTKPEAKPAAKKPAAKRTKKATE